MKENQKEETGTPFSALIRPLNAGERITVRDYFDALDCQVKVPLQAAYFEPRLRNRGISFESCG